MMISRAMTRFGLVAAVAALVLALGLAAASSIQAREIDTLIVGSGDLSPPIAGLNLLDDDVFGADFGSALTFDQLDNNIQEGGNEVFNTASDNTSMPLLEYAEGTAWSTSVGTPFAIGFALVVIAAILTTHRVHRRSLPSRHNNQISSGNGVGHTPAHPLLE